MSTNPYRAGVNPAPTVIEPKHKIVGVGFIPTRKISISESTQLFRLLIMLECSMCFYKKPYALCLLQKLGLFQILQRPFIGGPVSETLLEVFPDGTNLVHLSSRIKAKCLLAPSLCFRFNKGLLLQVIELLARDPDLMYDFRCCLHNKRPATSEG